jgi:hypothetical protein
MMKRSIATILIVLASTIWLAHAVIPHHHHQSQACLITKHCQHDHDHQAGQPETDPHQHDNKTTTECSLNQLAIVPQPVFKCGSLFPKPLQSDTDYDFIQSLISYTNSVSFLSPKTHAVYLDNEPASFYLTFIGHSSGLRAPPAV